MCTECAVRTSHRKKCTLPFEGPCSNQYSSLLPKVLGSLQATQVVVTLHVLMCIDASFIFCQNVKVGKVYSFNTLFGLRTR